MRLKYVDGLRGIAAFIVMLSHIFIVALPSLYNGLPMMARLRWEWRLAGTPLDIFWAANFAVCIFFVMSGLVLSAFCDKQEMNFVANCVRRYVRLGLPIFGGCAFAYFLYAVGLMQPSAAQRITQEGWLKLIYTEPLTFMHLIHESFYRIFLAPTSAFDPPLWTMHYEFVGSVGVFAIYALVPNRLLRIGVLLIAGVLLWQEYYFCFVVGVVLYEWMKEPLYLGDRLPSWPAWIFLVAGLYMGAFPYNVATPDNPWFGRMLFLDVEQWHRLGSVPFLFGVISLDPVRRFLMLRPFQYLGKISFALYLVHVPLIGSFMSLAIIHLYWPPHSTFAIGVAAACTMPMSVLCAHFIQRFIDGPAIRLSHLAGRWISEAFTAPLPSTMHAGVAPQSSELRQWSV